MHEYTHVFSITCECVHPLVRQNIEVRVFFFFFEKLLRGTAFPDSEKLPKKIECRIGRGDLRSLVRRCVTAHPVGPSPLLRRKILWSPNPTAPGGPRNSPQSVWNLRESVGGRASPSHVDGDPVPPVAHTCQ